MPNEAVLNLASAFQDFPGRRHQTKPTAISMVNAQSWKTPHIGTYSDSNLLDFLSQNRVT